MKKLITNKLFIIASLTAIFMILLYTTFYFNTQQPGEPSSLQSNTEDVVKTKPLDEHKARTISLSSVPTLPPEKGQGLDITSQVVMDSTSSVDRLNEKLPYEKNIRTTNGVDVTVVVPSADLQDNPWTLTVYFHGIDYRVPKESNEYAIMQTAFLESVDHLLEWIKSQDVPSESIIFNWGDKDYSQQRAEEWLK